MTALVFDVETNSLKEPEIIEAAWLELSDPKDLEVLSTFQQRYCPSNPIEVGAMAVHHILDEDLVGQPPSSGFGFHRPVDYLIGHQIDFDWTVAGKPEVKRIDVMAMIWKLWPEYGKLTQGAAMYAILPDREDTRRRLRSAHRAINDAMNCHHLLWYVCEKAGGFKTWEAMWAFSEEARVPTHIPFGKHRGTLISELPYDYREWILSEPDMDPYIVKAVKRTIRTPKEA